MGKREFYTMLLLGWTPSCPKNSLHGAMEIWLEDKMFWCPKCGTTSKFSRWYKAWD
jgi:hypothetical protein